MSLHLEKIEINRFRGIKMPEDIFKDVRFLEIDLELSLSDGPAYKFFLLDDTIGDQIMEDEIQIELVQDN